MRRKINKLGVILILFSLLPAVATTSTGSALPDDRRKAWEEILRLNDEGAMVLERQENNPNDQGLWNDRNRLFVTAAQKLEKYIERYETDPNRPSFVTTTYRLGTYWQIAYKFDRAKDCYLMCLRYPAALQSAKVNKAPLKPQVEARLREVERDRNVKPVSAGIITRRSRGGFEGIGGGPLPQIGKVFRKILGIEKSSRKQQSDDTAQPQIIKDRDP